jgi:hypothetical protein
MMFGKKVGMSIAERKEQYREVAIHCPDCRHLLALRRPRTLDEFARVMSKTHPLMNIEPVGKDDFQYYENSECKTHKDRFDQVIVAEKI